MKNIPIEMIDKDLYKQLERVPEFLRFGYLELNNQNNKMKKFNLFILK